MARDYKPRPQYNKKNSRKGGKPARVATWQWFLVIALIFSFTAFLAYIRLTGSKQPEPTPVAATETEKKSPKTSSQKTGPEKEKPTEPKGPHFDFYTVLPEKEVVVPEHEIKTRSREERVGKAKESKYIMQAGSYGAFKEADQLRAKLALMGIESKVEKAKVGDSVSYRVKMGPYTQMASVDAIKKRLKKSGIDAIVTESGETSATAKPAAKPAPTQPATPDKTPAVKPVPAQPVATGTAPTTKPVAKPVPTQPAIKPAQPQAASTGKLPTAKPAPAQATTAGKTPTVKPVPAQTTTAPKLPVAKPQQPQATTTAKTPAPKPTQPQTATGKAPAGNNLPIQPDADSATVITQPYR